MRRFFGKFFKKKEVEAGICVRTPTKKIVYGFKYLYNGISYAPRIKIDYEKLKDIFEPKHAISTSWSLVYSSYEHGLSKKTFHMKIENFKPPFIFVIQDTDMHVFGIVFCNKITMNRRFYGTMDSYLWRMNKIFDFHPFNEKNEKENSHNQSSNDLENENNTLLNMDNTLIHEKEDLLNCTSFLESYEIIDSDVKTKEESNTYNKHSMAPLGEPDILLQKRKVQTDRSIEYNSLKKMELEENVHNNKLQRSKSYNNPAEFGNKEDCFTLKGSLSTDSIGQNAGNSENSNSYQFERFSATGKNDFFCMCNNEFIAFGCENGRFGLSLNQHFSSGESYSVITFDNKPLCEFNNFDVREIEVWSVKE